MSTSNKQGSITVKIDIKMEMLTFIGFFIGICQGRFGEQQKLFVKSWESPYYVSFKIQIQKHDGQRNDY